MKIGFYSPTSLNTLGGAERWLIEVSSRLQRRGHETKVICLKHNPLSKEATFFLENDITHFKSHCIRLPYGYPIPSLRNVRDLIRIFNDCEVIYFFVCPPNELLAYLLRNLLKSPSIGGLHLPPIPRTMPSKIYSPILRHAIGAFDAFHVLIEYTRDILMTWGYEGIHLIPNGVDTDLFGLCEYPHNNPFTVLFTGRHSEDKGVNVLAKIIHHINERMKIQDIQFAITGFGPLEPVIEHIARKYDNVKYLGFVSSNKLPRVYRKAHLLLIPSRTEGMPLRVLEAQSSGLPVISSDIPGMRTLVMNKKNGFLINVDDVEGFSETIEQYYNLWKESAEKYYSLSKKIRKITLVNYAWSIAIEKLETMFEEVVRNRSSKS